MLQTDLSFLYLASRVLEFLNPDLKRLSLADVTQDIRASMMEEVPARLPPASPLASEWELGGRCNGTPATASWMPGRPRCVTACVRGRVQVDFIKEARNMAAFRRFLADNRITAVVCPEARPRRVEGRGATGGDGGDGGRRGAAMGRWMRREQLGERRRGGEC